MTYRPVITGALTGNSEKFVVCETCYTLVSSTHTETHDSTHRILKRKTPTYKSYTVDQIRTILNTLPGNANIQLEVSGYEWDEASLNVVFKDGVILPVITV